MREGLCMRRLGAAIPVRYVIAGMLFSGFYINYTMRVNLNLVLVAMVNHTAIPKANITRSQECHTNETSLDSQQTASVQLDGPFVWSEMVTGQITGAFFFGYIFTQFPGGRMAEIFSAKYVYGLSLLAAGALTLLAPAAAWWSWRALMAVRVLMGLSLGVAYPASFALLRAWVPPRERTFMTALVMSGSDLGTVVSIPTASVLIQYFSWEMVFYVQGSYAFIWFIFWIVLVDDRPDNHWFISCDEMHYVVESTEPGLNHSESLPIPWREMLVSAPLWATMMLSFTASWVFFIMLNSLAQYFSMVLGEDISTNALFTSLPYLGVLIVEISASRFADYAIETGLLSTWATRQIGCAVSQLGSAVLLVIIGFMGCHPAIAKGLLAAAIVVQGASSMIYSQPLELAPNFAGTIQGVCNTLAALSGFLAPLLVGALTSGQETLARWRCCFLISAGVALAGWLVFLLGASVQEQPWNRSQVQRAVRLDSDSDVEPDDVRTAASHVYAH